MKQASPLYLNYISIVLWILKKKEYMTKDLTLAFVSFGFRLAVSFWALPVFPVTLNLVMVSLSRLSSLAT